VRIAILWKQMSGYAGACFAALRDAGAELTLTYRSATADAPYDDSRLEVGVESTPWSSEPDEAVLLDRIERFAPDVLLVCSWDVGAYRRISKAMRGRTLRVLCMDNSWLGTPKQWGGRLVSPVVIRPTYDVAFLPGDRQADFARRLGFADDEILWGFYTCDHPIFSTVGGDGRADLPPAFVFAGRLVAEKGVDVLAEAYGRYRRTTADPWPLVVAGTGPLAGALAGAGGSGVESLGFV
jgi:glycosyltransferase involved in cell wall biosynthesis